MPNSIVKVYSKNKQDFTKSLHYDLFMNEDAINISRNLKLLMHHYNETQKQTAKRCDVSQKMISNLLNPKDDAAPNIDKVTKVAKGYHLPTWILLYPDVPLDVLLNHQVKTTINNLMYADKSTKDFISHVLEGPSHYRKNNGQ